MSLQRRESRGKKMDVYASMTGAKLKHSVYCDESVDLLRALPDDLLYRVTGFLNARSLLNMQQVNRTYLRICRQNKAGWDGLCDVLWADKIHVADEARTTQDRMSAYRLSVHDAATRHHLTMEEFCYPSTVWDFRFKESAGTDWTVADPW
jgi:hypothetical protein